MITRTNNHLLNDVSKSTISNHDNTNSGGYNNKILFKISNIIVVITYASLNL